MRMNDLDYREDTEIFRGLIAMTTRRAASSRGCWSFTRGWDWARILLSKHEGLRSSVTSRWLLTCSAIADRRETLKTCVDWSETFEMIQQSSARVVVRRLQRSRHSRKSTL